MKKLFLIAVLTIAICGSAMAGPGSDYVYDRMEGSIGGYSKPSPVYEWMRENFLWLFLGWCAFVYGKKMLSGKDKDNNK